MQDEKSVFTSIPFDDNNVEISTFQISSNTMLMIRDVSSRCGSIDSLPAEVKATLINNTAGDATHDSEEYGNNYGKCITFAHFSYS
jgi:hypothetical protein